jgi:exosortase J
LITFSVARVQEQAVLILVVSPKWSTGLPPASLVLLAYGSGVVLLLGGVRLYRAALFPILLLWFANPVPHAFSLLVDLPLQQASAHIARAFAMDLGHSLTPDHLRLMFTPDFGMFIAPGCDGIRGSVTMGFIALIAGYVYRFRWYANCLVVMGAILLGYIFNLLRLCLLVLYYAVALHFPSLQNKAEGADYVIGAALFLCATSLLFAVIQRLRDARPIAQDEAEESVPEFDDREWSAQGARLAVMGVIVVLGCVGLVRAHAEIRPSTEIATGTATKQFPSRLGDYMLVRTWNETLLTGPVAYFWAEYDPVAGGTPIAVGVSPMMSWHDPLICHTVRGDHPLWQGQLTIATAGGVPISFSSGFYNDGVTQSIEATTPCSDGSCGEFSTERTHFGFVYTHPDLKSLLSGAPGRPARVLLRVETINQSEPAAAARLELTRDLQVFLASVNLAYLTQSDSR